MSDLYGLLAEFRAPEQLLDAIRNARHTGYKKLDAFVPFPVKGLSEALGHRRSGVAATAFTGGVVGCVVAFSMQYYASVLAYPLNVGGRPLNSWPAFILITFELTVLFAALFCLAGMLLLNGLPNPYHPVFNVPDFQMATRDRFFLCIEASDSRFDAEETRRFLELQNPLRLSEIPK